MNKKDQNNVISAFLLIWITYNRNKTKIDDLFLKEITSIIKKRWQDGIATLRIILEDALKNLNQKANLKV